MDGNSPKLTTLWFLGPAAMLLIALFPLPYGYYVFLRIVLTIAACGLVYSCYRQDKIGFMYVFGLVAILFNPIIPIHLEREIWAVIDVLTSGLFVGYWWKAYRLSDN